MSDQVISLGALVEAGDLELGDGYRTKRSELGKPGLPILRVAEIHNGYIKPGFSDYVHESRREAMGTKTSRPGDIVLTTKGTVGRVAMIADDAPRFVYSPQVCFFRTSQNSRITRDYLYYWFKSTEFWEQAGVAKGQTDMADYLNLRDIRSLRITLPSLSAQRATSQLLAALDDKIAVNKRISAKALELARQSYLAAANSAPNWETVELGSTARWLSGGTPKTSEIDFWGGSIPWISAASLKSPWITDSDRRLTALGARSGTSLVPAESIIFVVRGSSLKSEFRVGLTQREVAFGQDCKALLPSEGYNPHLLFHAIRSNTPRILEMVDETSIGAGRLSTDLITKLEIRAPKDPSDTTYLGLCSLDKLAAQHEEESRTLAALRDTLLPQLMSGKLRVRDAERIVEDAV